METIKRGIPFARVVRNAIMRPRGTTRTGK